MHWDANLLVKALIFVAGVVVTVAGAAAAHTAYDRLAKKAGAEKGLRDALVLFALAVNVSIVSLLLVRIDAMNGSQRIIAKFYAAKDAYSEMKSVIEDARDGATIYALNSFEMPFTGIAGDPAEARKAQAFRREYFDAIEDKMGRINYHRVIQVRDGETFNIAGLVDPTYIDHFKKIVALQEKSDSAAGTTLHVTRARYSMSFVIVENTGGRPSHLIWQVDRRMPEEHGYKAAGYMIVTDPDEVILKHFIRLFNQAIQEKGAHLVHTEDLVQDAPPAIPAAATSRLTPR